MRLKVRIATIIDYQWLVKARKANTASSLKENTAALTVGLCCGWTAAHQVSTCVLADIYVSNQHVPFLSGASRRGEAYGKKW